MKSPFSPDLMKVEFEKYLPGCILYLTVPVCIMTFSPEKFVNFSIICNEFFLFTRIGIPQVWNPLIGWVQFWNVILRSQSELINQRLDECFLNQRLIAMISTIPMRQVSLLCNGLIETLQEKLYKIGKAENVRYHSNCSKCNLKYDSSNISVF